MSDPSTTQDVATSFFSLSADAGGQICASDVGALPSVVAMPSLEVATELERVRPHLIPARPSICIRAPCLKRNRTSPICTSLILSAGFADAERSAPAASSSVRSVSCSQPARHVHFDEAPPQEFFVHPCDKYDRRPIECTQGGSAFDMSLPPRSKSYNSLEDEIEDNPDCREGSLRDSIEGGLTLCGKSIHSSLYATIEGRSSELDRRPSLVSISANPLSAPVEPKDQVSLPVHGFRSFGGLSNGPSSSVGPESPTALARDPAPPRDEPTRSVLSPDATPMPSPSIGRSVPVTAKADGYFGVSDVAVGRIVENVEPAKASDAFSAPLALDRAQSLEKPRTSEENLRRLHSDAVLSLSQSAATISLTKDAVKAAPSTLPSPPAAADPPVASEAESIATSQGDGPSVHAARQALPASWPTLQSYPSPLSSRCSSVDPWSSLSSDGDGDGTDSPINEASWISSSCTSPELGPNPLGDNELHLVGKLSPSSSTASWLNGGDTASTLLSVPAGFKGRARDASPSDVEMDDETRFSSSIETISAVQSAQLTSSSPMDHHQHSSCGSDSFASTSEGGTPDMSRRPSLQHYELEAFQLSSRMKGRKAQHAAIAATVSEDAMMKTRTRSSSRDGSVAKKPKSSRCKFCRITRDKEKKRSSSIRYPVAADSSLENSPRFSVTSLDPASPSLGCAGLDPLDLESTPTRRSDEARTAAATSADLASRKGSRSCSRSRERSWDPKPTQQEDVLTSSDEFMPPVARNESVDSDAASGSATNAAVEAGDEAGVPTACTCDKKREKELLRKKLRKEREMERERDREWERDQARGRQRRLFGDSFDNGDSACLSALDGF